jgi:hypothetical protein
LHRRAVRPWFHVAAGPVVVPVPVSREQVGLTTFPGIAGLPLVHHGDALPAHPAMAARWIESRVRRISTLARSR